MVPGRAEQSHTCPLCGTGRQISFSRDLHRCRSCGIVYNSGYHPLSYDNDYFIEEYRNQYGRTYHEDFPHIYALAEKRLEKIFYLGSFDSPSELSVLDIGSALGFFLKAAQNRGTGRQQGIEISSYGAEFCRSEYGIPVIQAPFEKADMGGSFDIITAWFFLEHCRNTREVADRIFRSLNPGGVFAMAVPSFFGPLFRRNREEWVATHPSDHRVDFSPATAKKFLKETGFKKVKVYPCGIHPERVMTSTSPFYRPFARLYRLFAGMTGYSDTIEVYAKK